MHIFLDNFHQGGKYFSQIDIHQAELSREGNLLIKIFIYFILTDLLVGNKPISYYIKCPMFGFQSLLPTVLYRIHKRDYLNFNIAYFGVTI